MPLPPGPSAVCALLAEHIEQALAPRLMIGGDEVNESSTVAASAASTSGSTEISGSAQPSDTTGQTVSTGASTQAPFGEDARARSKKTVTGAPNLGSLRPREGVRCAAVQNCSLALRLDRVGQG